MHVAGKLAGRGVAAAALPEGQPGRLLQLEDEKSGQRFLVDTGSTFSILPYSSDAKTSGPSLVTADRTPIKCWGSQMTAISIAGREYKWKMLRAAVACPIIGADFLAHYDFMVDLKNNRLIGKNNLKISLVAPSPRKVLATVGGIVAGEGETCSTPSVEALCSPPSRPTHVPPAAQQGDRKRGAPTRLPHVPPAAQQGSERREAATRPPHVPPAAQQED